MPATNNANFKIKLTVILYNIIYAFKRCQHNKGNKMPVSSAIIEAPQKKAQPHKKNSSKPVALILAGYSKIDSETKRKKIQEMQKAYDGEVIYMGQNKFLHNLAGKPVMQYVIEAVFNAKITNTERLYDEIYVYNDNKSLKENIDLSKYPNLIAKQMKDSVGGHLKDFCRNYINYGQRVDIFFGDTPRITSEDVEWINKEYDNILGKKKDQRGVHISLIFSMVKSEDLTDNWLEHRLKHIKMGHNKGKLKYFVGFENFQARIGNSAGFIMNKSVNGIIDHQVMNFFYNLRKALTPSTFSKILFYFWKTKHFNMIKQVRNKCINEQEVFPTVIDIISKLYKIDLSDFGGMFYFIGKNASRWENDIDSPLDLEALNEKFKEI
jgi:hypothetical protein